ncbi:hypothetical protein BDZ89DRAFT_1152353 [Hymenopellis radicata]|nr:hypothetical protein BDZ89DRAFT_1152353 [Hymenopellis radicata]
MRTARSYAFPPTHEIPPRFPHSPFHTASPHIETLREMLRGLRTGHAVVAFALGRPYSGEDTQVQKLLRETYCATAAVIGPDQERQMVPFLKRPESSIPDECVPAWVLVLGLTRAQCRSLLEISALIPQKPKHWAIAFQSPEFQPQSVAAVVTGLKLDNAEHSLAKIRQLIITTLASDPEFLGFMSRHRERYPDVSCAEDNAAHTLSSTSISAFPTPNNVHEYTFVIHIDPPFNSLPAHREWIEMMSETSFTPEDKDMGVGPLKPSVPGDETLSTFPSSKLPAPEMTRPKKSTPAPTTPVPAPSPASTTSSSRVTTRAASSTVPTKSTPTSKTPPAGKGATPAAKVIKDALLEPSPSSANAQPGMSKRLADKRIKRMAESFDANLAKAKALLGEEHTVEHPQTEEKEMESVEKHENDDDAPQQEDAAPAQGDAQDVKPEPEDNAEVDTLSDLDLDDSDDADPTEDMGQDDEGEVRAVQDKGKGREHGSVSVVDEHGEQMEMGAAESIQLRMQKDSGVESHEGRKARRVIKETADLKNTVDEEHPVTAANPHLLVTLGAELPDDLDDMEVDDLFAGDDPFDEQGKLAPGFAQRGERVHEDYARVFDEEGNRMFEWHPPHNIHRRNIAVGTLKFFRAIAKSDPFSVILVCFDTKYRPNAPGNWIKEARRAFNDRNVDMTKVLLFPFRSTYEKPIAYNLSGQDEGGEIEEVMTEGARQATVKVDWPKVRENTLPAPGMLVTGLKKLDYGFLVEVGVLLHREGLNFGVLDFRNQVPTHHLTINNFALDNSPGDIEIGTRIVQRALLGSTEWRNFVAAHRDRYDEAVPDDEVVKDIVGSIRFQQLLMGGNRTHETGFKSLVFINASFTGPAYFGPYAAVSNSLTFEGRNGIGGQGEVSFPLYCPRCHGTNHPAGHCFIPKLLATIAKRSTTYTTSQPAAGPSNYQTTGADEVDEVFGGAVEVDPFAEIPRPSRQPERGVPNNRKRNPTSDRGGDQFRRRQ